jgi:hypothetical protein
LEAKHGDWEALTAEPISACISGKMRVGVPMWSCTAATAAAKSTLTSKGFQIRRSTTELGVAHKICALAITTEEERRIPKTETTKRLLEFFLKKR